MVLQMNNQKGAPQSIIQVGFSSVDLADCIEDSSAYRYPLEAKCMVVIDNNGRRILLYSLDVMELSFEFCQVIQKQIGKTLNMDPQSILIHTTHTHSAPWDDGAKTTIRSSKLAGLLSIEANEAISNAKPAKIKTGEANIGQELSIYRRADAGDGLGVQTFWFGYEFREGDDRPDASALTNEMKSRWLGQERNYKRNSTPVYFDHPVDPMIQTIYFEDLDGHPLGSIVRFSAHPHLTSACRNHLFDPDYPGRTRRLMEKELGGQCLFLLGPSGNLVPKERVRYEVNGDWKPQKAYMGPTSAFYPVDENELLAETERIGHEIARAAIDAINKAAFQELSTINFLSKSFDVTLDPTLPDNEGEMKRTREILMAEYDAFLHGGGQICELRRLANRLNWLDWSAAYSLNLLSDKERKTGFKSMPFSILSLNSIHFVFMHSEISMETTLSLRNTLSEFNPWTVMLTGGTILYVPTDKMLDEGGYEGRCTCIARGTEGKMRDFIVDMFEG